MISTLIISNFLSHQASSLNFSPGVNIIVGPTDSGKSAIVKALKWVVFNRPMGDGMRSTWGGDTVVSIRVEGSVITRFRETGGNGYRLDDQFPSEHENNMEFNAIKGEIPAEIAKILNLSDINLQTQFDSHFMLSKSSGEVAQYFNKIAHLDKIDTGLQHINKWTREVQRKIDYNTEALEVAQEKLKTYDALDSIEKRLVVLEEKQSVREELIKNRGSLLRIIEDVQEMNEEIEELSFLQELEETVETLLELYDKKKDAEANEYHLRRLIDKINQVEDDIIQVNYEIEKLELQFHGALGKGSVCPLCGSVIK